MDPQLLMDKGDRLAYEVVVLINRASGSPISTDQIMQELNISAYKLNAARSAISNDLSTITDGQAHIEEPEHNLWQAHGLSNLSIEQIKLIYIQRSALFTAFEYSMFYDNLMTPNQYLQETFVSRAAFYRNLKSIKPIINQHFSKKRSDSSDDEFQNRLTLFQLYYNIYNGLDVPFANLNELVEQIIVACTPYLAHPLRLSQRFKLSTFLRVWIMRHRNQHYNQTMTVSISSSNTEYQDLFNQLTKVLGKKFQLDKFEMSYLYGFLLAKQYIKNTSIHELSTNFPLATAISTDLIEWLKAYQIMDEFNTTVEKKLTQDLIDVNLQLTSFYIEPTTFVRENSINFFGKTYPSFDIIIQRFIGQLEARHHFQINDVNRINMYYGYMFALINNIPANVLKERVYIAVDFSQGDLYTQYVINSLDAFHHANIIIETEITSKTDIYISDVYSREINLKQLTWEDPPTPADWANLGAMIEQIRSKKAFALFNTTR
ncbi:hypothetical protein FEZ51_09220 [Pediococcus stilesii]|uniref:Mga helix-turn-helix domain-containing protein n=1 Tax=Pediococcus stilesii TaxID=331679 RepID=A0A5R9BS77_9LACO|nr:hypothetical protein [Pediococcus stilesii]TLQ03467.1 hypothetical protein FEZ51_09220 [Pediococcus stilesii]